MPAPTQSLPTDVHSKALAINLEQSIYGTFAEIGAVQEVARWFLSVGGASGTVADTVSARNYQGTNEQHGWLGICFQSEPGSEASQILLHINLADSTAELKQQAIDLLGLNLIYAAHHQRFSADEFLHGLFDDLSISRIEIDVLELGGPLRLLPC